MKTYTVRVRLPVIYTIEVEAEDLESAQEAAEAQFPGLPYIGEEWDEDGEPEYETTEGEA